jgi:hypothetical protein
VSGRAGRPKPPRALRRAFPLFPQGEMARELFERGVEQELSECSFLGETPMLRSFQREARELAADPLADAMEEPDYYDEDDDWDGEEP